GAHHAVAVVHHKGFGVDEAGGVLEDFDTGLDQGLVVGPGDGVNIPLVRHMGGDDPHVHTALGSPAEGFNHLVRDDEVGGGDVDIPFCPVDEVHVDGFAHCLVIQRAVGEG